MSFSTLAPAFASAALIAVLATGALAQGTAQTAPAPQADIFAPLTAQGYRILDADAEGPWFEVEAIAPDGRRVDLIVDAATGAIAFERLDD